ncbi:MAG: pantetheine-phosphate adenylyltransferase [Thermoplasmata archaeon]
MPRFRHVVLGGTFDRFHAGHEALLATAFRVGARVSVGITSDRFLAAHPKPSAAGIQPYTTRARAVRRWVSLRFPGRIWAVVAINDGIGGAAAEGVDALVVSRETISGGRAVNAERRRLGRAAVPLVVVPLVLAEDLRPVSSRRIRAGEIDGRGRRRVRLSIGLGVEDDRDRPVAIRAIRRAIPRSTVTWEPGPARLPSTSSARAKALATGALRDHDLSVGVARRSPRGWALVERSREIVLSPRELATTGSAALGRAVEALVRPARAKRL